MHQFEPLKINFKYASAAIKFVSFEEMEDLCQLNHAWKSTCLMVYLEIGNFWSFLQLQPIHWHTCATKLRECRALPSQVVIVFSWMPPKAVCSTSQPISSLVLCSFAYQNAVFGVTSM